MPTATSSEKSHSDWTATYRVVLSNGLWRAQGRLMNGSRIVRDAFSVRIGDDGGFAVDTGTGSGIRVGFVHKGGLRP